MSSRYRCVYKKMGKVLLDESIHNLLAGKKIQPRMDRLGILKGLYVAHARKPTRLYDLIDASFQHMHVIHINGNQWDYRISNLRPATRIESSILNNTLTDRENPGLVRQSRNGSYTAAITLNKVSVHLGTYATKALAIQVYQSQILVRHQMFAAPDFSLDEYKAIKTADHGRKWLDFNIRREK